MNGWFGISSLESLSQGKPVIAGLDEWNIQQIQETFGCSELPWVVARNKTELEAKLGELINDSDQRSSIGRQSRQFMEAYWNEQKILSILMNCYTKIHA
jgi:glycosyltransferase involved in cell wall biosynthesis